MEKYAKIEKIGEGTYGVVYRGKHKATDELVALKKIRMDNEEEGVPSTALREVSLLLEAEHPNIVKLIEVIMNNGKLYLVFEYVNTDMRKWLDRLPQDSYLEEAHVKSLFHQILQAILFCHRRRIVHRDLKPQNVLISNDGRLAKVADFGLARAVGVPVRCLTHEVVTLWYRAPEVLLGAPRYSTPIDIWSLACIFVELATKQPLFRGDSEIDQLFRIFRVLGTPNDTVWPGVESLPQYKSTFPKWRAATDLGVHAPLRHAQREGLDLLAKMIAYEPAKRLNAQEALLHEYFQTGFDHSTLPAKWPEPSPIELWQRSRMEASAKGPAGDRDDALRLVA